MDLTCTHVLCFEQKSVANLLQCLFHLQVIIFTAVKIISILSKWLIVNCYGLISLKKYATGI